MPIHKLVDATTQAAAGEAARAQDEAANEAVYDAALSVLDEAPRGTPAAGGKSNASQTIIDDTEDQDLDQTDQDPEEPGIDDDHEGQGEPGPVKLSAEQMQVLRRQHITPEMIAGWTPKQIQNFLDNAGKRETDQAQSFSSMREELTQLRTVVEKLADGKASKEEQAAAGEKLDTLASKMAKQAQTFVETFGEEVAPFAETLQEVTKAVETIQEENSAFRAERHMLQRVILDQAIAMGIRDLASEFEDLAQTDARQKLVARFQKDGMNHKSFADKNGKPFHERVTDVLRELAADEFGDPTPPTSAANPTRDRVQQHLRSQPKTGSTRGRPARRTVEDIYDEGVAAMLAKGD